MWKRIISWCSDSSVRTEFSPEIHGEIDIERSELKRRVSHLRIPQKSPVSGQFAAGSRSILGILRIESEREHSRRPQPSATVELIPPCMYVHASLGDTSLPASVRGSRGRPQPRSRSRKYRSRMVSVLPVSSPNYSETLTNSSETTYVDLTECARITPSFYYRRARVLTFRFL